MKNIIPILLFTTFCNAILAQEQDNYEAMAEKRFALFQYTYAIPAYEKLVTTKKPKAKWFYNLGYCYHAVDNYTQAAKWYSKFLAKDTAANTELYITIADLYKMAEQYDSAMVYYNAYIAKFGNNVRVNNRVEGCKIINTWTANPTKHIIQNVEPLNTRFSDWGAVYGPNDSIIFISDFAKTSFIDNKKSINPSAYKWNGNSFYKIYEANNKAIANTDWYEPQMMRSIGNSINQSIMHIGPLVFTKNFDTAYYTQTYDAIIDKKQQLKYSSRLKIGTRRLELFCIVKQNNTWQTPFLVNFSNKNIYNVGHAALNNNGTVMYFTSDMPGGFGKTDIWYSTKNADGSWSQPTNCGSTINTEDEEAYPTIDANNNFYFASNGHIGMGGFDIFEAKGEKNNWQLPKNLQSPINTSQDDFWFVLHSTNQKGMLSSNRKNGYGSDDIFAFNVPQEKPVEKKIIKPANPIVLVTVKEKETNTVISDAFITLVPVGKNIEYKKISTPTASEFTLNFNSQYTITANKNNMGVDSTAIVSTSNSDTLYATLYLSPKMPQQTFVVETEEMIKRFTGLKELPPKMGDKFVLKNLYYNLDKFNIRQDASKILDTLVMVLKYYPTLEIELSSHTDSRASFTYNNVLSNNRAKAAIEYLVQKGIERKRLVGKGYGETRLVNKCADGIKCSEQQHQLNRRTEVAVIKF